MCLYRNPWFAASQARKQALKSVCFGPFKGLVLLGGGYFLYIFSGFAIDRSKKHTIEELKRAHERLAKDLKKGLNNELQRKL